MIIIVKEEIEIELGDMDYWWYKDNKYKEMADNLFINGIMDDKEYTSVINKKDKNCDVLKDDYKK